MIFPSLLNSIPPIGPERSSLRISVPELESQNLKVLSSEHDISCLSFGVNRICLIPDVCPSKITFGSSWCSRSNMRSFLSFEPLAKYFEHDEKFTDLTICLWVKLSSSSPDTAFHIFALKSAAPLAALLALRFRSTPIILTVNVILGKINDKNIVCILHLCV